MIHLIGDITLTLTVLLLAIMNHCNGKKIDKLEGRLNDLMVWARITEYERREP